MPADSGAFGIDDGTDGSRKKPEPHRPRRAAEKDTIAFFLSAAGRLVIAVGSFCWTVLTRTGSITSATPPLAAWRASSRVVRTTEVVGGRNGWIVSDGAGPV